MARYNSVSELNLQYVRPARAGIIVYTVVDGELLLALGRDSLSGDITDFGGGVRYKHGENVVTGSLREFNEETLDIFGYIHSQWIQHCLAIYDSDSMITFIPIYVDPYSITSRFRRQALGRQRLEIDDIIWLTVNQLAICIASGLLYDKVANLISTVLSQVDLFSLL